MALKTIMLRRDIEKKQAELDALREKDAEFETREADLEIAIGEAESDEQRDAVANEVETFDNEKTAHEEMKENLTREIAELEAELAEVERAVPPVTKPEKIIETERSNIRMNFSNIRSLPMGKRAFDSLSSEERNAILAQDDVKSFLNELRSYKGQQRAISGGQLTIPVVLLDMIAENMFRYSKLMNRVRVRNVNGQARQTLAGLVPEAVWTEMCGNINELNLQFGQITLDGYKVAGYVPVCNALLEDNDVNLASFIVEMISESIGLAKDKAILYGKGAASHMPLGIATRLAQTSAPAGYPATAPAWVDLHTSNIKSINGSLTGAAFWAALNDACANAYTKYARGTEFWAMNSKTLAALKSRAITFTASGDVVANIFGTLPVISGDIDVLEFMPDGDIIGGFGDLYLWAQRSGMEIESSREVQFIQDNTVFRGKERADGSPIVPAAFVAINIAGSTPTTEMTFAGDEANTVSGILLPTAASLIVGETLPLKATLVPYGVEAEITYASATTSKATISSTGVITGVGSGSSVITATAGGFSANCTVTVTSA